MAHRLITALVALALTVVVAAQVVVVTVQGRVERRLAQLVETASPDLLRISVKRESGRFSPTLTPDDVQALQTQANHARRVAAVAYPPGVMQIIHREQETLTRTFLQWAGVIGDYFAVAGLPVAAGRGFTEAELESGALVAVVGAGLAGDEPGGRSPGPWGLGQDVTMPDEFNGTLKVIGILAPTPAYQGRSPQGASSTPSGPDYRIFVPFRALVPLLEGVPLYPRDPAQSTNVVIALEPRAGETEVAIREAEVLLLRGSPERALTITPERVQRHVLIVVQRSMSRAFLGITILAAAVALAALTSHFLRIVMSQARAIGIKRALGLRATGVLWGIFRDSLALIGAVFGVGVLLAGVLTPRVGDWLGFDLALRDARPDLVAAVSGGLVMGAFLAAAYPAVAALRLAPGRVTREAFLIYSRARRFDLRPWIGSGALALAAASTLAILGSTRGALVAVDRTLEAGLPGVLTVRPGVSSLTTPPAPITFADALGLREHLTALGASADLEWFTTTELALENLPRPITLGVVTSQLPGWLGWEFRAGGPFERAESASSGREVILGPQLARALFGKADPIGEGLELAPGEAFTVTGVLADRRPGELELAFDRSWAAIIPQTGLAGTAFEHLGQVSGQLWVRPGPESSADIEALKAVVIAWWTDRYPRHTPPDVDDPGVQLEQARVVRLTVGRALLALLGVAYLAAGATLANLLLMAVREQRWEIAVQRAIGSTRWQVFLGYLSRGVRLALPAGILGAVVGSATTAAIWATQHWGRVPPGYLALIATAVVAAATLTGMIGALPAAWFAARTDLVSLLKEE